MAVRGCRHEDREVRHANTREDREVRHAIRHANTREIGQAREAREIRKKAPHVMMALVWGCPASEPAGGTALGEEGQLRCL